jgi:hypothetical protein
MARNFGVPPRFKRNYRGSLWPLLPMVFMAAGVIDVIAHLHRW